MVSSEEGVNEMELGVGGLIGGIRIGGTYGVGIAGSKLFSRFAIELLFNTSKSGRMAESFAAGRGVRGDADELDESDEVVVVTCTLFGKKILHRSFHISSLSLFVTILTR
jgi:hypothetical protein